MMIALRRGRNQAKHTKNTKQTNDSTWPRGGTVVLLGTVWPCQVAFEYGRFCQVQRFVFWLCVCGGS